MNVSEPDRLNGPSSSDGMGAAPAGSGKALFADGSKSRKESSVVDASAPAILLAVGLTFLDEAAVVTRLVEDADEGVPEGDRAGRP